MSAFMRICIDSDSELLAFAPFSCSSSEMGGEGGSRLAGCWTLAVIMAGEFKSNCWTVLFAPNVNRLAAGP